MSGRATHPSEPLLALFAGGDLNLWRRAQVKFHVDRCGQCGREVKRFINARAEFRNAAAVIPDELSVDSRNWDRLAREIRGNISVGLAAGECVAPISSGPERIGWRMGVVFASLALLAVTGWWVNIPQPQSQHLMQSLRQIVSGKGLSLENAREETTLRTTPAGLELKQNGRGMTLLHPESAVVTLSVSTQGSVRARYLDVDSGQVTINNVYAQ